MAERKRSGTWPYHGFTVRYHRLADPVAATPEADALWWAAIPEAPEIPPLIGKTLAIVQAAAEQAIDALLAAGNRAPPAPRPPSSHSRYHRITAYLAARPVTEHTVVLSFAELEDLLGRPLAETARGKAAYWTTLPHGRDQGWNAAGWRAALQSREHVVVFTRRSLPGEE